jgi:hypothetical protein
MTKNELVALFAGLRALARFEFWFWFPADPVTGAKLIVLALAVFIRDAIILIVIPKHLRNQGK